MSIEKALADLQAAIEANTAALLQVPRRASSRRRRGALEAGEKGKGGSGGEGSDPGYYCNVCGGLTDHYGCTRCCGSLPVRKSRAVHPFRHQRGHEGSGAGVPGCDGPGDGAQAVD